MSVLVRSVVALPLLVFLVIVGYVSGVVIDPIANVVLGSEAVSDAGFGEPLVMVIRVGIRFGLPGIGFAIIVWWVFGAIRVDARHQPRQQIRRR